ncbi:MAG: FAD:protein transferase [Solirubrobacteraceae bacterium]|nr:FAD:protein transferase [Solirubrobacteraceae bacterium]
MSPPSTPPVASLAWSALGSTVLLQATHPSALATAHAAVEDELAAIDRACSRFRPDSDLARINAHAGRAVRVDPLCAEAVEVALRAALLTGGAVDPALGRELVLAGYDRDFELLDQDIEPPSSRPAPDDDGGVLVRARTVAGWRTVAVDRRACTVRVGRGVSLDLGATAKALAADRAAAAAHAASGAGVLVGLGGDIAVAGPPPDQGWAVFVTHDHRSGLDAPGQMVSITQGGLATSSTLTRRWAHAGSTMHHIIDPATGRPARELWTTASVAAATCVDANIASTAALVRGRQALGWLRASGLPARLVAVDGRVVRVGAWPAEEPARPAPRPAALAR